jgi:hypothetical protein
MSILKIANDDAIGDCGIRNYLVALYVWTLGDAFLEDKEWFEALPVECIRSFTRDASRTAHKKTPQSEAPNQGCEFSIMKMKCEGVLAPSNSPLSNHSRTAGR